MLQPERALFLALLVYLAWLPLPFGSNVEWAQRPLILVPLVLCAAAALLRTRESFVQSFAYRVWTIGGVLFALVVALQLVPLPPALLTAISPESAAVWASADRAAALARGATWSAIAHPVSVDPAATMRELFRVIALFAAFQSSALLVRGYRRRLTLAGVLCAMAIFEMLYGVREAALRRYEIWGWHNTLIFNRITGTFVNPNHYAHYLGIIFPLAVFIAALAWHRMPDGVTFGRRIARILERHALPFGTGTITALGCLAAVLMAQSRGGLVAIGGGCAVVGGLAARELTARHERRTRALAVRLALGTFLGVLVIGALIVFLGRERTTIARLSPNEAEQATFVGRRIGIGAALDLWQRFPILGCGLGAFEALSPSVQRDDVQKLYHHAHDDYAELLATTGAIGFTIAFVSLVGGWSSLARMTFGRRARSASWNRRAYQCAALASLTIAMVHALFDFNFFIPANAATLAVIVGAAVAPRMSKDVRAPVNEVPRQRIDEPDVDPIQAG